MSSISKTKAEIVKDVRICYDEIALNDSSLVGTQDESELDTIIESKIDEAITFVYGNANEELFDKDDIAFKTINNMVNGSTHIGTVDTTDMLRVLAVQCSSWSYAISDFYKAGSPDAAWVTDEYCGATNDKPAVIETIGSDNKKGLRLYKGSSSSDSIYVVYIPNPATVTNGNCSFSEKLYPAVIYYICGLVAVTFGEKSRGQEFMEVAVSMIGGKVNG